MKFITYILFSCGLILSGNNAFAFDDHSDLTVNITGAIVAPVCSVTIDNKITLGTWAKDSLSTAGATTETVPVDIVISKCPNSITEATATFSGTAYSADPSFSDVLYANSAAKGASDVGLQLYNMDGKDVINLANETTYSFPVDSEAGTATFKMGARLYTPHGSPTAGDFEATITVDVTYK
ncbi:fimbrial protein [Buttiauxella brennerae]|nr:fimbrial protein [Buttiauxella brennerae]